MEAQVFDDAGEAKVLFKKIDELTIIQQKIIKRLDELLERMEEQEIDPPSSEEQNETIPQGATVNRELKAAFDKEVDAVAALINEYGLIREFTPAGEYILPQNVNFIAPAIVITRLLSGYWISNLDEIFNYALCGLKNNTRIDDIKIEFPTTKDVPANSINPSDEAAGI